MVNRIDRWLAKQWVTFVRRPSLIVRSLGSTPGSLEDLRVLLRDEWTLLDGPASDEEFVGCNLHLGLARDADGEVEISAADQTGACA
jgi:hypothetical protein